MSSTSKKPASSSSDNFKSNDDGKDRDDQVFECNICLDTAKDAVISMCGHLFWYVSVSRSISRLISTV